MFARRLEIGPNLTGSDGSVTKGRILQYTKHIHNHYLETLISFVFELFFLSQQACAHHQRVAHWCCSWSVSRENPLTKAALKSLIIIVFFAFFSLNEMYNLKEL
jgi:hypothetical protein